MKKTVIFILVIICIVCISAICLKYTNVLDKIFQENEINDRSDIQDSIPDDISKSLNNIYIDKNPMSVGFYLSLGNKLGLVSEYSAYWYVGPPDICVMLALPTNKDIVNESDFKTAFNNSWKEYDDIDEYKIGYHIKFSMNDGEIVDKNILTVGDTEDFFSKIMVFLYDDIHLKPGERYYHITEESYTDETIFTSIKLTGGVYAEDVKSPIELSVFTYKDENDFDPDTGIYRGNSIYTINIYKK